MRDRLPGLVKPDTEENLHRLFLENGWTDGLPIVLPTEARVAEMLKGTSHKADEEVGKMQPSSPHESWSYTVEKVAVNAVMAGAKPEHFPVILALASTGVPSLFTSTTSFASMVVVNGPIRNEIKMNAGIGALGPFNQANSVIGRAWTLMSMNLAAAGKSGRPTWAARETTTTTTISACLKTRRNCRRDGIRFMCRKATNLRKAWSAHSTAGDSPIRTRASGKPFHTQIPFWLKFVSPFSPVTLLLDPTIIKQLKEREGFDSKEQLIDWIYKNTSVTVAGFSG